MHKPTEGTGFIDDRYEQRRHAAKAAGFLWGSFHFSGEVDGTGVAQADHYLSVARVEAGDFICIDREKHGAFANMEGLSNASLRDWGAIQPFMVGGYCESLCMVMAPPS
jgi:GH25 family lysozyme M1 (1,4-beta-N-acetylmuramidase)